MFQESSSPGATIKSERELKAMRSAGKVVALMHEALREATRPGVTTGELDRVARVVLKENGAQPSFLNYEPVPGITPYPGVICTSLNEEIVHGIPGKRVIQDGDLVKLDVGAVVDGFHGDAAVSLIAGEGSETTKTLVDVTRRSLEIGIAAAQPGNRIGDIGAAIEDYVLPLGFELVREYTGHGIGRRLHEPPQVPNFRQGGRGIVLKPGMTIAIEPMVNVGGWDTRVMDDGWTVVTDDGALSAHFEHTIAITESGPEILTILGS
ncbi:MAG: type I methionyl aminopeptidase [Chloroflexi bacterium]|nr:type I methionyl aminopeptidase [Chloroflexota bacterium]